MSKEIKFDIKDYFYCLVFLLILFFVSIYVNSILYDGYQTVNFMYVASPPQDGLPFLTEKYGWLVYISHYALTVITAVTLCYLKPIIVGIKNKLKKVSAIEIQNTNKIENTTENKNINEIKN